jgi:hypothetical protein
LIRFYTPSDKRKKIADLYRIKSVEDYVESISNLLIDEKIYRDKTTAHHDYLFIDAYICELIQNASRVIFVGGYDFLKEAYFLNKFPHKKIILADVSKIALEKIQNEYKDVEILQATTENIFSKNHFVSETGDLIILNTAEYFMSSNQMKRFICRCKGIVLFNNSHLYNPSLGFFLYSLVVEIKAALINLFSILIRCRQMQFRGWIRTKKDYERICRESNKYLKNIIIDNSKITRSKYGVTFKAIVCFYPK